MVLGSGSRQTSKNSGGFVADPCEENNQNMSENILVIIYLKLLITLYLLSMKM